MSDAEVHAARRGRRRPTREMQALVRLHRETCSLSPAPEEAADQRGAMIRMDFAGQEVPGVAQAERME